MNERHKGLYPHLLRRVSTAVAAISPNLGEVSAQKPSMAKRVSPTWAMNRRNLRWYSLAAVAIPLTYASTTSGAAEPEQVKFEAAAIVQLAAEPPARLLVDAPLADQLALGRVVLRYRTENLKIAPVYGAAALQVSPRIGHLHITVDDGPWRWVDASGQPVIINKLLPGKHKVLIELVDPTHNLITAQTLSFEVPKVPASIAH